MKFRQHPVLWILVPLCLLALGLSFYRFMVVGSYVVEYQGACDPETEHCFVGCNDDACQDTYYYTKVKKYAPDVYAECGPDVTDCAQASVCLPTDASCSITYCSPETALDDESCEDIDGTADETPS